MKKLLCLLLVCVFAITANAQSTSTEVAPGKIFGHYKGIGFFPPGSDSKVKAENGETLLTGVVSATGKLDWINNRWTTTSVSVKIKDGTAVIIGTMDNRFTLPETIVGRTIIVEGIDVSTRPEKINPRTVYQKDIQFAASGIKIIS